MSKKEEASYETLISALTTFNTNLLECAENMSTNARTCADVMENDDNSERACARIEKAVSAYRNVTLKVTDLQKKLLADLERIKEINSVVIEEE